MQTHWRKNHNSLQKRYKTLAEEIWPRELTKLTSHFVKKKVNSPYI